MGNQIQTLLQFMRNGITFSVHCWVCIKLFGRSFEGKIFYWWYQIIQASYYVGNNYYNPNCQSRFQWLLPFTRMSSKVYLILISRLQKFVLTGVVKGVAKAWRLRHNSAFDARKKSSRQVFMVEVWWKWLVLVVMHWVMPRRVKGSQTGLTKWMASVMLHSAFQQ